MSAILKWIVAVFGWIVLLIIFSIWKDIDAHMGGGALSGALRGALIFGGSYLIYRWARGGKPTEE